MTGIALMAIFAIPSKKRVSQIFWWIAKAAASMPFVLPIFCPAHPVQHPAHLFLVLRVSKSVLGAVILAARIIHGEDVFWMIALWVFTLLAVLALMIVIPRFRMPHLCVSAKMTDLSARMEVYVIRAMPMVMQIQQMAVSVK